MKLIIFDLDDTLVTSDAKIRVFDPVTNKEIKTLTPSQFNHHKINKSYFYDFDEFQDPDILKRAKIHKSTFDILKKYIKGNQDVSILTARDSHEMILNYFRNQKCYIKPELIFTVGGEDSKYTGTVPERKQQALKELIDMGYTNFIIYDDNIHNLDALKKLESDQIKIKTIHILHGET